MLKEKGHPIISQLLRDFAGAEAADDATVVVRFAEKRARDVPLFVAGLPIFSRAYYSARPFEESTLDIPLGSGAYKVGRFEPAATSNTTGSRTGGAPSCRCRAARTISTWCATNTIATATSPSKGFTAKNYLFREEFTSRIWATRYDFPGDPRRPRQARRAARRHAVRRAGLVHQHAARQVQGPPPARGADLRLRFRMDQQDHHVRLLRAHPFGVPEFRHDGGGQARARTKLALLEPFRGKVPDEVFGEPFVPPVSDGSGQDRKLLRKAAQLLQRGRLRDQGRQARRRQGRAHRDRVPARRADLPAASHAVHQESRHARHRRDACASSIRCSIARASTTSISTSRSQRFGFSTTPGDSLRTYFSSQAAALQGLAEPRRHRRSGDRRADRHASSPPRPGPSWSPPAGRSTA